MKGEHGDWQPRLRIFHVVTRWQRGGAERNIEHQIEVEQANGDEVVLVVGPDSIPEALPDGVETVVLDGLVRNPSPRNEVRAIAGLRRLIDDRAPDVVATHFSKPGIIGAYAVRGRDRVTLVHHVHMPSFGEAYPGYQSRAFAAMERRVHDRRDLTVFVGREMLEQYRAVGAVRRDRDAIVVRSPARVEEFTDTRRWTPEARNRLRAEIGVPASARVLVSAGTLEARKRHEQLIAWLGPRLVDEDLHLVIAGEGRLAATLFAQATAAGLDDRVHLVGYRKDLPVLLAGADAYVHGATTEGVPQVVLQALAAGTPVVATATTGLGELPPSGLVVVPASGVGFADAVQGVLDAPPEPAPIDAFDAWTKRAVRGQIDDLRDRILTRRGRTRNRRPAQEFAAEGGVRHEQVAVVVPTHDRPEEVAFAIRSILDQQIRPAEVVIVSDVPSTRTAEVVAELAADAPVPIRYVEREGPPGVSRSRNEGVARTSAPFVAFLDDDDTWAPEFLGTALRRLHEIDAGFVVTGVTFEGGDERANCMVEGLGAEDAVVFNPGMTGSNAVYRRSVFDAVGGFDPDLWVSNDKDLLIRLLENGVAYATVPAPVCRRGVDAPGRLGTVSEQRIQGLRDFLDKHGRSMTAKERRLLRGRLARVQARSRSGATRVWHRGRMVALLGPRGLRTLRSYDRTTAGGARVVDGTPVRRTHRSVSDAKVIRAARAGDLEAFSELRRRHGRTGVAFAHAIGGVEEDAWLALLTAVDVVPPDGGLLAVYLRVLVDRAPIDPMLDVEVIVAALDELGLGWLAGPVLDLDGHSVARLQGARRGDD